MHLPPCQHKLATDGRARLQTPAALRYSSGCNHSPGKNWQQASTKFDVCLAARLLGAMDSRLSGQPSSAEARRAKDSTFWTAFNHLFMPPLSWLPSLSYRGLTASAWHPHLHRQDRKKEIAAAMTTQKSCAWLQSRRGKGGSGDDKFSLFQCGKPCNPLSLL